MTKWLFFRVAEFQVFKHDFSYPTMVRLLPLVLSLVSAAVTVVVSFAAVAAVAAVV